MRSWVSFCWVITIICTLIASTFLYGAINATAAPAQAGAAAVACALAIIPYVFTRAFDLSDSGTQIAAIRKALDLIASERQQINPVPNFISPATLLATRES